MSVFDNLALLRAFVAIAESGSISAAARKLHLTQPTLSRNLRSLEASCGLQLVYRDTHRMHLTVAGHQLLEDARAMLQLAEESEQHLRDEKNKVQGHLRVFSTIDFGQSVVSRLLASFIQDNPAVSVELAYSNRPLHMLEEGCDVGIIAGDISDDTIVARSVGKIVRHVVASPELVRRQNQVRTPNELQNWRWLTLLGSQFNASNQVSLFTQHGERCQITVSPTLSAEGVSSLREAARMGLGVAILPTWLSHEDIVAGRLIEVLPKWQPEPLQAHVVYPSQRRLPLRVRALIDFAEGYMSSVLAS